MGDKHQAAQLLGRLGGKQRAKNLTARELSAIGRKGGNTRTKNLTAQERSDAARRAVEIRWAKVKKESQ